MSLFLRRVAVTFAILALVSISIIPAGAGGRATDAPAAAQLDTDYVTVQLADAPLASYTGTIASYARTKPQAGKELNLNSAAARAYGGYLAGKRQNYKKWLATNAAGAQIVHEFSLTFNGFAVKLNGEKSDKLGQGPGTRRVDPSFMVRPAMNISPALINAPELWLALGGPSNAGDGMKVGILDTGIDTSNPFLSDSGYPATAQTDACAPFTKPAGAPNTTNKVIVCRIFASGVAPGAHVSPSDLIVFDHGTHVSGTVAGNNGTTATVEGTTVTIAGLSGIAPSAWLGDYNIFPGFGAGFVAFGGSAFSHDIIAAIEAAIGDGMDVLNMSIGGKVQGPHDTLAEAVDAAADAGVIVAVAAGNSGPGDSTVESPGSAAGALTAGASTNPHFVGQTVSGVHSLGTVGAAVGQFTTYPDPAVTESWVSFGTNLACTANVPAPTTSPQIAVISRGTCTFTTKVRNAQNAGYAGVVIRNNVAGDPIGMAQDGTTPVPTIPAVMIQRGDLAGTSGTATAGGPLAESVSTNSDIIAGFSSRGPTPFTFLIKPDATAPGVNVLSSVFDGKFAFFQGTSMATPH